MSAIEACRTAALGGHVARCENPRVGTRRSLTAVAATGTAQSVKAAKPASGWRRGRPSFWTFNDWNDPPPGFCEIDMVAHGCTSVAGSFIQTLTLVDVATGWTECLPLVSRGGGLMVIFGRRSTCQALADLQPVQATRAVWVVWARARS